MVTNLRPIVKFLACLLLVLPGCGTFSATGSGFTRSHPLQRMRAFPSWESSYLPPLGSPEPEARKAPPVKEKRSTATRSHELTPGQVPTGMPDRLAMATTATIVPADTKPDAIDSVSDEEPDAVALAIRSLHPSLVTQARGLVGKPLEPGAFLSALVETTTVSSAVAERSEANPVRDLFVRLRRQKKTFEEGAPHLGDLVFFHNTRDLNGDNRNNDWYTSVGVVTKIDADGTVFFIAPGTRDVQEMRLNLTRPRTRRDEKRQAVLNDYVRPKRLSDPSVTQYLAGELFAGFGRL